jgi:Uma2 family endonuclease
MATAVLVSVEEYLNTSYDPDCEYVDGEVVERNLGEKKHSKAQRRIIYYLGDHYTTLRERIYPEQRVQVKANRFRVPDLCIAAIDAPDEQIFRTPPELCIEILSPKDTMTRTLEKIKDYLEMGVRLCWILDPVTRQGWIATPGRLEDAADGILRADGIEMPLSAVLEG